MNSMAARRTTMDDEEIGKAAMLQSNTNAYAQTQARRKGIGVKVWLVVSETGQSHLEEVEKHSIMRRTGLPARDLRALDPMLSYPSSILGRERAIVINLEHIKAVITAKEMSKEQDTESTSNHLPPSLRSRRHSQKNSIKGTSEIINTFSDTSDVDVKEESHKSSDDEPVAAAPKQLPFEFRALEACLESACRCLESETHTLEEEAYPALDELTSQISTLNLERVREIKSRLVTLSGRVQKVRDELENLLDDDNDMAEMYLTRKLASRSLDQSSPREVSSIEEDDKIAEDSNSEHSDISSTVKPDVEELEMLIEAYFAQIDGILQKLSDMSEYVDDTEDCINIMLDDKQNQLLQVGVILNTANMILNAGIVVVGLFGMNIHISLYEGTNRQFWEIALGTLGGCIGLYVIAVGWGKKRYLLPS
ncbi:magnesium transporter MRS2-F-like isoform X2 [Prosopis cineraria]|uniref:magnesium transporter MRS2-F-like isoform X2 n=1 Tax=Prosopis cineraria TaxID=364024 RepID=UPI00240FF3B7|nr:magnesium transporter MRS2-F-like isoform X2 [Prosopis cineraria]